MVFRVDTIKYSTSQLKTQIFLCYLCKIVKTATNFMPKSKFESLDPRQFIIIKGARLHNLKNLDVAIPRNKLVVITGLSGSGKSSLAFDTLFAEGQRRYVESLSSYARQFVGRMNKPEVDYIKGISPAIAIEQKVNIRNPRSTVGTSTEIYDYLKLLYARAGRTYSPVSGELVKRHSVTDVVDFILENKDDTKIHIYSPVYRERGRYLEDELSVAMQKGFTRAKYKGNIQRIEEVLENMNAVPAGEVVAETSGTRKKKAVAKPDIEAIEIEDLLILTDRLVVKHEDDELKSRIADSVQTAFFEGKGECRVEVLDNETEIITTFSNRFEADGIVFEDPSPHLFSFNSPFGACPTCEGFGSTIGIDEDLVIPNKSLSIYDNAIACWRGEKMKEWNDTLVLHATKFDFPIHRPYHVLTAEEKKLLWTGNKYFKGLNEFFKYVEEQTYKIQYRVMLSRYRGKTVCPDCKGSRLRKDVEHIKVGDEAITGLVLRSVEELHDWFLNLKMDKHDAKLTDRLVKEITSRLKFLCDVGLGYLSLNRLSNTLSGGESQRINLATSLGSSLVGSMYILDEPSIGLHPRDTERLVAVLQELKRLGNTVIVVEHEEEIMKAADEIIDIGPLAGTHGGELVYQGSFDKLLDSPKSLTGKYLKGIESIGIPTKRRNWKSCIEVKGARENNLKGFDVKIPLGIITCVTGVSGSGKTSLVKRILYPALKKMHGGYSESTGSHDLLEGDVNKITSVEFVDQNPIGKSSRSNPVTYVKAFDEIRELFSELPLSKNRRYKASRFSFNVEGGRCETCQGEGEVTIEMQFMADIHITCETCKGKRYKEELLEVMFHKKNISDVLNLTVEEAIIFFSEESKYANITGKIVNKLQPLEEVGLGYITLGQSSSTLSGGEAQRVKLASFLAKGNKSDHTIFFFDEPTTGLHFHDIKKLLHSFNALIKQGNTVIIIEHNTDVIKCADWVIDLGPDGGDAGGHLVFAGTPEDLAKVKKSHTAQFLAGKLKG